MSKNYLLVAIFAISGSAAFCQEPAQVVLETSKINNEIIEPAKFKTVLPFELTKEGILIVTTYWGKEHKPIPLQFDNGAPTTVDSLTKTTLTNIQETNTHDKDRMMPTGQKITNHFLVAPNVQFGGINVQNVAFLETPYIGHSPTGLLGRNIQKKGIWKIDFLHKSITFTNNIDSIGSLDQAKSLPVKFDYFDKITVKVKMEDATSEVMDVDFGYNGAVILPLDKFTKLAKAKKNSYVRKATGTATTLAGVRSTNYYVIDHGILSFKDDTYLDFEIASSDIERNNLLGLGFFSQFEFVIIDYINKAIYLSKKKVPGYYKSKY